jgi:CMP-N,N'-diacetyllegionaminic acid synthase
LACSIGFIPARAGSKGIKEKNIRPFAGKPLIEWTIESALKCNKVDHVVVSTDSKEIARVSKKAGAEIISRPSELAGDKTPMIDAVTHGLDELSRHLGEKPDLLVLLQPTSPLRTPKDIDEAVDLFLASDCDSVISVSDSNKKAYHSFKIQSGYLEPLLGWEWIGSNRQDLPCLLEPNGAIYVIKPEVLKKKKAFITRRTIPYLMPPERSVDIDTAADFALAEWYHSGRERP